MVFKFVEHFYYIAAAMNRPGADGMWDEEDGFYYDLLRLPDGSATRLKVRSMVGLLPAVRHHGDREVAARARPAGHGRHPGTPAPDARTGGDDAPDGPGALRRGRAGMLALVNPERLRRILTKMLDENEFLSPYGIRSLSKFHERHPYVFHVHGQEHRVDYLPAESNTGMFGGNSNWRGPVWMPVNAIIIRALLNFYLYYGDNFKVECPTGSGRMMNLFEVAKEIADRLARIFLRDERAAAGLRRHARSSRPTRTGATTSSSTSTSTATTARSGQTVFTENDIRAGQESFLTYGLMQYGSVYGHGAYLGPDFTADYLHRLALEMRRAYGDTPEAGERVRQELRENRYDPATDVLTWPDAQARAFEVLRQHYEREVLDRSESGGGGLGPHAVPDPAVRRQIVAFVAWTSWTAAARRPNKPHFVHQQLASRGTRWQSVDPGSRRMECAVDHRPPRRNRSGAGPVRPLFLVPWLARRRETHTAIPIAVRRVFDAGAAHHGLVFFIVAALFCVQTLLGGATAHYHADTGGFFGYDLASVLPYNLARTWHLQLGLFWVVAAFLAAGIYLAPVISGSEPRGQSVLSVTLLVALVVVVVGSLAGEAASYKGWLTGSMRPFLGAQGWEYLDLGRLWQMLLIVGLVLWCVIVFRGLRPKPESRALRQPSVPLLL